MSLGGAVTRRRGLRPRPRLPTWSAAGWSAIGLVAAFVLLTVWWLTQDTATPAGDAPEIMWASLRYGDYLLAGDVTAILDYPAYYPPYGMLFGALVSIVAGDHRNALVLGENLVCLSLLAVSCYQIGKRVAGSWAGVLAVAFALGSPLVIEQFHVFMLDPIVASLVAVSVWLIIVSDRFRRIGIAALAGIVVGIGLGTKEQFPLYLVGLVCVVLVRGGWRNGRGLAAFLILALLVGAPWYVHNIEILGAVWSASRTGEGLLFEVPPLARPPLLSIANVEWYGWATLNGLLFAPLTACALVGVVMAIAGLRRPSVRAGVVPELLGGLGGSWLLLTLLMHKDMRYTLPMIVYLAVLGTAWIVRLPRPARGLVAAGLAAAVVAATVGATFGVGGPVPVRPPGNLGAALGVGVPPRDRVIVYANHNYLVAGPRRDGNMLELLRGLNDAGISEVFWDPGISGPEHPDFNGSGLTMLARVAGMSVAKRIAEQAVLPGQGLLIYERPRRDWAPCLRFGSGMGVWVLVFPVDGRPDRAVPYCPGRGVIGPPMAVPRLEYTGVGVVEP